MMRRKVLLALAASSMTPRLGRSAPESRGPRLWIATRGRSVVTLFGQMPVRSQTAWRTPRIERAFDASELLWLENPSYAKSPPAVLQAVESLSRERAVPPDYSILNALGASDAARLRKLLAGEGLSESGLTGRSPRDVRQFVAGVADKRTAADYGAVPEAWFRSRADALGKPIRTEWRDLLDVVRWSSEASPSVQLDTVRLALDEVDQASGFAQTLNAWASGNIDAQAARAHDIRAAYPELVRRLNDERNAALAERLSEAVREFQTQFVCVGVLHLLGAASLQDHLRRLGFSISG
jgi:uncharacterized protein YbaP (TraB family)